MKIEITNKMTIEQFHNVITVLETEDAALIECFANGVKSETRIVKDTDGSYLYQPKKGRAARLSTKKNLATIFFEESD